ncbi:hypothetical protein BLNAU_24782 [Blattamonas nauphoetae]|uniref:Uncharacterized protein n=1 Tax=Blattamonas nauphoetae TaxID=2049346 RepID=A0ABQ9WLH1_9EUKA|nr:hypothetical protein BLNAU_24782 [Blattamonas nauphoetae]
MQASEAVAQVSLNVSFTNCEGSSAPKGSGGLIYVSGDSQLDFCDVSSEETSTGECGGAQARQAGMGILFFSSTSALNGRTKARLCLAGRGGGCTLLVLLWMLCWLPASYQQAPHHYVPVWSAQQPADFQQYPLVPTYEIDLIHSKYAIVRERLSVFYELRGAEGGGWV